MVKKKKHITYHSTDSFLECVSTTPKNASWAGKDLEKHFDDKWSGASFKGAIKLATYGWPEGLERLNKKLDLIKHTAQGKIRINDIAGDMPIVPRFLAGLPDCMNRRVVRESNKKPILDIYFSCSMSGSTDIENLFNFGAAIASVVDTVESLGYSVALTNMQDNGLVSYTVPVKQAGEAMDLEKTIYWIAHPSVLRRLEFQHSAIYANYTQLGGFGMGSVTSENDFLKIVPEGALSFVAGLDGQNSCRSPQGAMDLIMSKIKAQKPELMADMQAIAA